MVIHAETPVREDQSSALSSHHGALGLEGLACTSAVDGPFLRVSDQS